MVMARVSLISHVFSVDMGISFYQGAAFSRQHSINRCFTSACSMQGIQLRSIIICSLTGDKTTAEIPQNGHQISALHVFLSFTYNLLPHHVINEQSGAKWDLGSSGYKYFTSIPLFLPLSFFALFCFLKICQYKLNGHKRAVAIIFKTLSKNCSVST